MLKKHSLTIIYTFLLVINFATANFAQTENKRKYTIDGTVKNPAPNKKVYLMLNNARGIPTMVDSSVVKTPENSFHLEGNVVEGGGFYIVNFFNLPNSQKILAIMEGGEKINIKADGYQEANRNSFFEITSTNSKNIPYFNQLIKINQSLQTKVENWNKQYKTAEENKEKDLMKKIQEDFKAEQDKTVKEIKNLLPEMGSNLVALWATNFLNPETDLESLKEIADRFKKDKPTNYNAIPFIENVKRMIGVKIGLEAPEISMKMPNDSTLTLSSLRGKYILIDFWASWCGPCRKENPNVVKVYNKYKNKNFDILSVSLDQDKSAWIRAIQADNLTWNHVSDLQQWNSAAAAAYGVKGIPATFLLDKEGKVIAMNLRGEALESKLEEILGADNH
ncbi:MAG: AhpC/TSA family protein [Pseudarcicella sp.]|nr:AhpC/TSA family protein [Pseudarcicella sp.]MBP6411351.1 AhpC/TSA family protein [Pseudarcicella sp.]